MRFIDHAGLGRLLSELRARGFELIGPTVRDGAIMLGPIEGIEDLPRGIGDEQEGGRYRLIDRGDDRLFGFAHGPDSAKRFLFPAREVVERVHRTAGRLSVDGVDQGPERYAFIGLRSCDLHAIEIQDRVFLGGPAQDERYGVRRRSAFFVGVDCAEPGGTCFCASTGTGPACTMGFDLALTELGGGFLVRAGSEGGRELLEALGAREPTPAEGCEAKLVWERASGRMGRTLDVEDVPELLARNREHPRWAAVAEICLACGNCTAACPTCFCHDVVDTPDLLGETSVRSREWASCFSTEFSHTVGGDVRHSTASRYRQWLTHKFSSWVDQFGTSGCVGCGRCITWCPVGIDVTREIGAIRETDGAAAGVNA